MNNRTSVALLAFLTAVGTLTLSSAYAQTCVGCEGIDNGRMAVDKMLLNDIPVSVWTDKTTYNHDDQITVKGNVANVSEFQVTLTVMSPLNSIVTVAQLDVNKDRSFGTTLSTKGELWKYNGTYIIKVNYGTAEKSNWVNVNLTGPASGSTSTISDKCGPSEIDIGIDGQCIPYSISGGSITSASINTNDKSIVIGISTNGGGTLTINPTKSVLDGIFMVLVDGQEWNDVEISDNKVTVMFPDGTEKIEIIGTFVIPEFGTIAVMILAVAIISIIAISARSRLSVMPRY
jgi:predicted secreted protein with PEFG-CTERM motif